MLLALLLAAAVDEPGAIGAERAFAQDAQIMGQWLAFSKWADDKAVMFTPQPVPAQQWLKGRKEPPVAVQWWPAQVWLSCDGNVSIHQGPWRRDGGRSTGWFTTVWHKTADGWRWLIDHGDATATPVPAFDPPVVKRAACSRPRGDWQIPAPIEGAASTGDAPDGSMHWTYVVGANGERYFWVRQWDGQRWITALNQRVAGEAK